LLWVLGFYRPWQRLKPNIPHDPSNLLARGVQVVEQIESLVCSPSFSRRTWANL